MKVIKMTKFKPIYSLNDIQGAKSFSAQAEYPIQFQNDLYVVNSSGVLSNWDLVDRKVKKIQQFKLGTYLGNPAVSFENQCFIISTDQEIKFFNLETGELKKKMPILKSKCGYYCTPNYYAVGDHNMNLSVFDLRTLDLVYAKSVARMNSPPNISGWLHVGINESLQQVYTTPKFVNGIEIRNLGDGEKIGSLEDKEFDDYSHEIFFINEERQRLFAIYGWTFLVWDLKTKKLALECALPYHTMPYIERKYIISCAISSKHDVAFVGFNYGHLIVVSLKDGSVINDIDIGNYMSVKHICVFDDLDLLVTMDGGNYLNPDIGSKKLVWKLSDLL